MEYLFVRRLALVYRIVRGSGITVCCVVGGVVFVIVCFLLLMYSLIIVVCICFV